MYFSPVILQMYLSQIWQYLLFELGFTINYEKSVLMPAHSIKFLCFIIDSNTMTIRPTSEKLSKLKDMAQSLLNNKIPTVYNLASFIGFIVSNFPAVKYGQLHYRNLETSNALTPLASGRAKSPYQTLNNE